MDKLIVMDFRADWCAPCRVMEKELWHNPEMQKLATAFAGIKVNVGIDKKTATDCISL